MAKLERMVLGKNGILLKAVGKAIGQASKEIDGQIKALEDRAVPIPLPLPDRNDPTVRYCGLWNSKSLYGPGAMVTCNGAGWIAMSAMGAGSSPGSARPAGGSRSSPTRPACGRLSRTKSRGS